MKKQLCFFTAFLFLSAMVFAQTEKQYSDYLVKESNPVALKYADPYFPSDPVVLGVKNDRMEEYAKLHQPIPLTRNTGDPVYDKAKSAQDQQEWIQQNPYYPQFIPYHLYNFLLTPEDDVKLYEAAKEAWKRENPSKAMEIENSQIK